MKDFKKSKKALKTAKKAFFKKDPEAIALLQDKSEETKKWMTWKVKCICFKN